MKKWLTVSLFALALAVPSVAFASANGEEGSGWCCPCCPCD
jgi:hypothetical protein